MIYSKKSSVSFVSASRFAQRFPGSYHNGSILVASGAPPWARPLRSSDDVLQLVRDSSCSAYDCEFVALAKKLSVPLVTEDKQILKDFPMISISLAQAVKKLK